MTNSRTNPKQDLGKDLAKTILNIIPKEGMTMERLIEELPDDEVPRNEEQFEEFMMLLKEHAYEPKNTRGVYKLRGHRHVNGPRSPKAQSDRATSRSTPSSTSIKRSTEVEFGSKSSHAQSYSNSHEMLSDRRPSASSQRKESFALEEREASRRRLIDLKARKEELSAQLEHKKARNEAYRKAQKEHEEAELREIAELERLNAEQDAEYETMQMNKAQADEEEEIAQLESMAALQDRLAEEMGLKVGHGADTLFVTP